jgi:hypothetical protein
MAEMRALFQVWLEAKRKAIRLPETEDPDYATLDLLMRHPLRSSRGYLTWICQVLDRPDPGIPDPPEPQEVEARGADYIDTLEKAWDEHIAWMTDEAAGSNDLYTSRWGQPFTIEGMLEHAAVHPSRHRFQLEELLAEQAARH